MCLIDGGVIWIEVVNVFEVYVFGFGKVVIGSDYLVIFIVGYVNSVWGIWCFDNNVVIWVKIGDYLLGNFSLVKIVMGDMDCFGWVYVGFGGVGVVYVDLVMVVG